MLRVRFLENATPVVNINNYNKKYYNLLDLQFLDIFLPSNYIYKIVNKNMQADICICGIQHTDNSLLRKDEINILYSIENLSVGRTHYKHFNKFGRYGNPMIDLYIYNDIIIPTEKIIPAFCMRINYYNKLINLNSHLYYEKVRENYKNINTSFKNKKFCLFVSQNMSNSNKKKILNKLQNIGKVDFLMHIAEINTNLKTASCFNSFELLKVFNQYKFIICFENSNTKGYITEKIFNVFLSKSIPIYDGDPEIDRFINRDSYLAFDDNLISKINLLNNNESEYNKMINAEKTKQLNQKLIENYFDKLIKNKNK
jgi:hypothetical protein